ncbi:hypothetical protein B0O99DRAFT_266476 [Bisporella sp. PMI_857]|nr:hypothetical protein B0O99DRAFT_266476 [Bisporella sp. PMI_857]
MQSLFPFVVVSGDATVPYLSRTSPFLLLAILTVASSMDPQLRHQIDQEFRRILSAKVIMDGQKSLDYLQGLLIYIAWYPLHSRPKNNQTFMYINVAISLAVDLGLHNENPSTDGFTAARQEGLVANGCFTQEARRAYLGAYYVSSALSMGFQKPNHLQYRNLMDAQGEFLLQDEHQTDVIALVTIQRIIERISIYHREKEIDPNDVNRLVNAEISVQIFYNELEQWQLSTPDETRNIPMVGLAERFAGITIYSHQVGFLKHPYRDHIDNISKAALQSPSHLTACLDACKRFFEYLLALPESLYLSFGTTQWALMVHSTLVLSRLTFLLASTMGWDADTTRANVPMVMYLDALCYRFQALSGTSPRDGTPRNPDPLYVFKMVLESVKRSYEKRVANIMPKSISVEKGNAREMARGHCPVLDPTLKPYFTDFQVESENGGWGDMTAMGSIPLNGADWSRTVGTPESLGSYESMGSYGSLGTMPTVGGSPLLYHDLWATMTCSWAAEEPGFNGTL